MIVEKATQSDINELETLYNNLNDYLDTNVNYSGWIKGVYPIRETAVKGIEGNNLFVLRIDNSIAGSIILNHDPEKAYDEVEWGVDAGYKEIFVIHTLVVSPEYIQQGVGCKLMTFAHEYALKQNMKSIRLDVSINNMPAIALYEKLGYKYMGTVDLGLNYDHLKWFKLYELLL